MWHLSASTPRNVKECATLVKLLLFKSACKENKKIDQERKERERGNKIFIPSVDLQ